MQQLTKTSGQTLTQSFAGYSTYQLWVLSGDVAATAQVTSTGVDIELSGGTPGSHQIAFKVSGADPEQFDTFDITVTG